jgi:hypothetical protein
MTRYLSPSRRLVVALLASLLVALTVSAARAEVSAQDGYGPDGAYQVHIELVPYLWLPALSGDVKLGRGASVPISAGIPSLSHLATTLTGAFLGAGLVRYGPWSGEIDIDYVSGSQTKGVVPGVLGFSRSLKTSASLVRVAPGIGYQVFNGPLGSVPATLDARVGFAYFASSATLDLEQFGPLGREHLASVSDNGSFVQPWAGLRGAIYPWRRWRFELAAVAQGFGVSGGVWGWGVTATGTWAATNWLNLIAGFRALNSARNFDSSRAVKSLSLTAYGPLLGVGFSF